MQDLLVTRILQEAARAEGSTQALATRLHAPEGTLALWIAGRAQTPLRAFLAALDFVMQAERAGTLPVAGAPDERGRKLVFPLGRLFARCQRCDATEFAAKEPESPLRLTSTLVCTVCKLEVVHGNLVAQLAKDAVQHSRAASARSRRAAILSRESVERGKHRIEETGRRVSPPPRRFTGLE
jgi:hypothetical protein